MTVTPASSTPSPPVSTGGNAMKQLSGNFSTFLTLLTSQLKNQDPTSPMDSNTFTQQLVMYSQVEQQINTNDSLKTLIGQGTSNAASTTAGYLGKHVSITNGNASLSGGGATWTYDLNKTATSNQLTVSDANGRIVYSGAGENTAGSHSFNWNGQDNNGNQQNDGTYKLTVTASDSTGNAVTNSVASAGTVTQIDMTGTKPKLVVGSMEIEISDISAISN